ncbi:MAG TPA: methyltransferase domain-containing protein [Planctomycetota bacterium]
MGAEAALACSVRGCGAPLARAEGRYACPRGHAFDLARSGYLSLLQPQDRRSTAAGDARAEVAARARLHAAGLGRSLDAELARLVAGLGLGPGAVVVDLGAGSGERLAGLCATQGLAGLGLDLSVAAMELAARAFPQHTWVVANADRRLPLRDASVALVLTLHGRRNPRECRRVLAPGGHLLAALPAADDLIELRARVQGQGLERERTAGFLAEHGEDFTLAARATAREQPRCSRSQLDDLLAGTYRGARRSMATAVQGLAELSVTLASELLLLAPRAHPAPGGAR